MLIYAILPAAGTGSRAGFAENKLFQKIDGETVLHRAARAFARSARIAGTAVCVSDADRQMAEKLLADIPNVLFVAGGATRTASVQNALEALAALPCPPDFVLIHDAARPFVTQAVIDGCIDGAIKNGSAVCAVPCTDTLVRAENGFIVGGIGRENAYLVQTPQGFAFAPLYKAYRQIGENEQFTDDSGVYARYVAPPCLCAGDRNNQKLTFAEDFAMNGFRTGVGVDTHAFLLPKTRPLGGSAAEDAQIVLGGVRIPSAYPLAAHSDGDVLAHAVMDALLSAAGQPDIGHFFPDTDPQYRGADSLKLLKRVFGILEELGFAVNNVSAAVLAERPKLAPHIAQMKRNLAAALGIAESAVGISAGTNEGLGYLGRGEGITVIANVTLGSGSRIPRAKALRNAVI